jgi:hypothetical protein
MLSPSHTLVWAAILLLSLRRCTAKPCACAATLSLSFRVTRHQQQQGIAHLGLLPGLQDQLFLAIAGTGANEYRAAANALAKLRCQFGHGGWRGEIVLGIATDLR